MTMAARGRSGPAAPPPIRIDAHAFAQLMRDAKAFDRDLGLRLRRNMRLAAKPIVADVKRKVLEPPPGGGERTAGTRAAIARGVGLKIGTGSKGGRVTIAASGRALPANRRAMLKAYNSKGWRHPVFADAVNGDRDSRTRGFRALNAARGGGLKSWVWVWQEGNPYFSSIILEHKRDMQLAVLAAMDEAARALARKNP